MFNLNGYKSFKDNQHTINLGYFMQVTEDQENCLCQLSGEQLQSWEWQGLTSPYLLGAV